MHIRQKSSRYFPADVLYGETSGEDIEDIEREVAEILQRRKYESVMSSNYDSSRYRYPHSIVIINHIKQNVVKMEPITPKDVEKSPVESKQESNNNLLLL